MISGSRLDCVANVWRFWFLLKKRYIVLQLKGLESTLFYHIFKYLTFSYYIYSIWCHPKWCLCVCYCSKLPSFLRCIVHVIFYHILANGNDRKTKDKIIVSTGLIFKLKKYIYNIMFTHQDHPIFQLQCIWVEYVCLP